jgi:hypothetical protein
VAVADHKFEKAAHRRKESCPTPGSQALLLGPGKESHDLRKPNLVPVFYPAIFKVIQKFKQIGTVGGSGIGGKTLLYSKIVEIKIQMGFHCFVTISHIARKKPSYHLFFPIKSDFSKIDENIADGPYGVNRKAR